MAPEALSDIRTRGGQLYNTWGLKFNLFVAWATRRIPLALTGCVWTHSAWESTGAVSGDVVSHLTLKWATATLKKLPQKRRRPHHALPLQCCPVKWTQFAGVMFHRIPRKPQPGQCTHLSSGEISGTRQAARNALQICWRSPLQTALIAGFRALWRKLDGRMETVLA